jgi:transcriptional regulator with XRE-family HTH domain
MSGDRLIAERLRQTRERAGLALEQLDDLAGLPRGSVEAYELTQRWLTPTALRDLARALNVPASELRAGIGAADA